MSSSQPGEEKLFVSILKCWGMLSSGLECGAYRLGLRDGDGDAWWVDSVIEWCGRSRSVSGGGEVEVVV